MVVLWHYIDDSPQSHYHWISALLLLSQGWQYSNPATVKDFIPAQTHCKIFLPTQTTHEFDILGHSIRHLTWKLCFNPRAGCSFVPSFIVLFCTSSLNTKATVSGRAIIIVPFISFRLNFRIDWDFKSNISWHIQSCSLSLSTFLQQSSLSSNCSSLVFSQKYEEIILEKYLRYQYLPFYENDSWWHYQPNLSLLSKTAESNGNK